MKRQRLSLDVDSVIADTHAVMERVIMDKFHVPFPRSLVYQWDSEKCLLHAHGINLTGQDYLALFDSVWERWDEIPPTADLRGFVPAIREFGFDVDIVTYAKTDSQFENKVRWLEWNIDWDELPITLNARDFAGWKYEMPYDIFVDDCPHIVVGAVARGKVGILYDQPWNRGVGEEWLTARIDRLWDLLRVLGEL